MPTNSKPKKNSLSIRLTESAVFLRTDYTPTRQNIPPTSSTRNGLLRGLLVLEIAKPTKISSIEVELTGTTFTAYPEGVGSRRAEVNEEHKIFHASTTYFRACPPQSGPSSNHRRTASIGPGISYNHAQTVHHDIEDTVADDEEDEDSRPEGHVRRRTEEDSPQISPPSYGLGGLSSNTRLPHSNPSSPVIRPPPMARMSSRRLSIEGSQVIRPSLPFFENYPGELAPIPPYSPLPPSPIPSQSGLNGSTLDLRRTSFAETIPEDVLEHRFDHHGLLRTHHEDEEEEEFALTVGHEDALDSPRPHLKVPSTLQTTMGGSGLTGRAPPSPLIPMRSASGDSGSSSGSIGIQRSTSRPYQFPPSPNPSISGPPLSSSAFSSSSMHSNMLSRLSPISSSQNDSAKLTAKRSPSADRNEQKGRSKRFSLSSMFNALRSGSPKRSDRSRTQQSFEGALDEPRGRTSMEIGRDAFTGARSLTRSDRRGRSSSRYSDVRLEGEEEDEDDSYRGRKMFGKVMMSGSGHTSEKDKEGSKEFKKGTYTYPISFSIPSNAPPSMQCDYGSVQWQLQATIHRPGTFKTRMTAQRDVVVVTCPTEEDTEDTDNIIVERHWEQQLQYLISISGRSFYIGGTVPVTLTLMPLAKTKIHRLSVILEEKVEYYSNMRRIARADEPQKFVLLQIRREGKSTKPILPLESNNVDVLRGSPLMDLFDPEKEDLGEFASNLMGPGPWSFQKDLKLPTSCDIIRFTNRNKRANMQVTHMLKVVMRVERGDDLHMDKNGKRKLFDIVVQTPVLILSCRCNTEWTSLPRYTQVFSKSNDITPSCPCHTHAGASYYHHYRTLERNGESSSDESSASNAETSSIPPLSLRSLRNHEFSDGLLRQSNLFERLVSGQESETGEAPPAYDVLSTKHPVVLHNVRVVG